MAVFRRSSSSRLIFVALGPSPPPQSTPKPQAAPTAGHPPRLPPRLPPPPHPPFRYRLDPVNKEEIRQGRLSESARHTLRVLVTINSLSCMTHRPEREGPSSSSNSSAHAVGLFDVLALLGSGCLDHSLGNSRDESYRSP